MSVQDIRSEIRVRLQAVEERITAACARSNRPRSEVTLIAVTKTVTPEVAALLPEFGILDLAESRPQELWKKAALLPTARWHLIGHLQRNKLDRTLPLVSLMHSADSERILESLSQFGAKRQQKVPVLLEVNCSREANKGGFAPEALPAITQYEGISVEGLMTMAAHSEDPEPARATFAELRTLRDQLRQKTGLALPHLSMGMSNDFEVAIEEGSTFLRLGSVLFEGLE